MTDLSPALDAELSKDVVTIFAALTMTVGADTIRLLDGSSEITINGNVYSGEDADYGVWAAMGAFEDGTGDEAPGISITIHPANDAALLAFSSPAMQGETVQVHIGAIDPTTGAVIGDAFLLFNGEVEIPKYTFGLGTAEIEMDCVGGMERLFFNDEGIRLAPSFHNQVWPGETGLNNVTGVRDTIYWGSNNPTTGAGGISWWFAQRMGVLTQ